MASQEEINLQQFREIHNSVTPGKSGVKHDGELYKQAKWANEAASAAKKDAAALLDRFGAGKAGVRFDGDLFGMLRRTEHNTAVTMANTVTIQNLVTALSKVSGGEAFDEAKLLASIEKVIKDNTPEFVTANVDVSINGAPAK